MYQKNRLWMTILKNGNSTNANIFSFYMRLYDLVSKNDFDGNNKKYLN